MTREGHPGARPFQTVTNRDCIQPITRTTAQCQQYPNQRSPLRNCLPAEGHDGDSQKAADDSQPEKGVFHQPPFFWETDKTTQD